MKFNKLPVLRRVRRSLGEVGSLGVVGFIISVISLFMVGSFSNVSGIARYKSIPLDYLVTKNIDELEDQENSISFEYRVFNKYDCKKYLGREEIIKKG